MLAMMNRSVDAGRNLRFTCPVGLGVDRWLHQALRTSWNAVLEEALPADLLKILQDQSSKQQE